MMKLTLLATLQEIKKCNCSIYSITVMGKGDVSPNEIYNNAASILIQRCLNQMERVELVVDKRDRKARYLFDQHIQRAIGDLKPRHEDSTREPAIQAVDMIAYAIRQKYQYNVTTFYEIIKEKIVWEGTFGK